MGMLRKLNRVRERQLAKTAKPTFGLPPGLVVDEHPDEDLVPGERLDLGNARDIVEQCMQSLVNQWLANPSHTIINYVGMIAVLSEDPEGAFTNLLPLEEGIKNLKSLAAQGTIIYYDRFDNDIRKPVPDHMYALPIYVFTKHEKGAKVGVFFLGKT